MVAIDKAVPISNGKPFNGPYDWLFSVAARVETAALHLLIFPCGLPILRQRMLFSYLLAVGRLDKPAYLLLLLSTIKVIILEDWLVILCLGLASIREEVQLLLRFKVPDSVRSALGVGTHQEVGARTTPSAFSLP